MMPVNESAEHATRGYVTVLVRRWLPIAVAVIVVVLVAVLSSLSQTPRYRSEAEVLVGRAAPLEVLAESGWAGSTRSLANELRRAKDAATVAIAREAVGSEPEFNVRADPDAGVLYFEANSSYAALAATAANAYAEAFTVQSREAVMAEATAISDVVEARLVELDLELGVLDADDDHRRAILEAQRMHYSELLADLSLWSDLAETNGSQLLRSAEAATDAYEPATRRNFILAVIVGLLLGIAGALLMERFDTSLRNQSELEAAAGGLPTLAIVPAMPGLNGAKDYTVIGDQIHPEEVTDAFRALRTSLDFLGIDRTIKTVAFTSPGPGEGTTLTAAHLAVACARAGQRVVLVDCALRQPRVHEFFDLPNDVGFTTVLLGEASLETAAHRIAGEPGLVVITSGPIPPAATDLLGGKRARSLINSVSAQADLVIIDSPPVASGSDALVIGGMVDGVILVASAGRTPRSEVGRAVGQLKSFEVPLVGTVLNQARLDQSRTPVSSLWEA